ncbi:PREDICTED: multidrug resistance-associated protein 4-like isoform X2 [Amphimedon queenslandica]|uniref:Uncharacterized protein n=1 Tax=Amphimedon queenslandica TaxID=400682 RepID=A0AAN0IZ09_AMPQE|nr:PREDICTED: multidrug resistance-associated protein 4-like isoform X2 [Amphimedon queenslandica]|eukprot:XP_019850009.1 PREDICTED: multidrug resistance-associated protein 4-like isoform X2 [Amphimedon queenslandica]
MATNSAKADSPRADNGSKWTPQMATLPNSKDYRRKVKYNLLFRTFFCWVDPLFWLGCRRSLDFSDLYKHPPEADSRLVLDNFNKYWSMELQRKKDGRTPRLLVAWLKCTWWRVCIQGLLLFLEVCGMVALSELLGSLTDYFVIESPTSVDTRNAYLFAMGLGLVSLAIMFFHGMNFHQGFLIGLLTKIMFSSAIYQKTLSLSQTTVGQKTIGHIVNLASNDIQKFEVAFAMYHFLWIGPIHVVVVTYLLYLEVEWTAFIVTLLLVLQIPLQMTLLYFYSKLRFKATRLTDRRVKVMNEVISGIRVIKMYAWEYAFSNVVSAIRKSEIFMMFKYFMFFAISNFYKSISITLSMFLVFSVYVNISDEGLTPRKVFVSLSLITFVRFTSIHFFILCMHVLAIARVSWIRIGNFLVLDDLPTATEDESTSTTSNGDKDSAGIANGDISLKPVSTSTTDDVMVQDLTASWSMDSNKLTLRNISFTVNKEKPLLAVVGSVGCGKSTLLQCLLKELPALSGTAMIKGSVGYASQEAWVFSATLRDNILFGLPYDPDKYQSVIEACALEKDIELLPEGDFTLVGERGVTLSGGQKARVNLARAVYRQADIYLLDDPLSAVDAAVSRHLFEKCIRGILSDKIVILVTHQVQYLERCDAILGLKEGSVLVYGDALDILKEDSGIYELLADDDNKDSDDGLKVRKQSIAYTGLEAQRFQRKMDNVKEEDEENEGVVDDVKPDGIEKQLSEDTEVVHKVSVPAEERAHGTISLKTYVNYFVAGGGYAFNFIILSLFILTEANLVVADWWISDWADCESEAGLNRSTCLLSDNERIGIFGGLVGSLSIFTAFRAVLFYVLMLNASRVVHNRMFARVLRAPILFFDTNPIGRVLNRFSKDVEFLDERLVIIFLEYLIILTRFFAAMFTASVANPYVLIVVAALFVTSLAFRWYYLKTARDIKRLEALSRSPIYSHLSLTLQGLPTIRSYSMQSEAMNHFHTYQNHNTQANYLYIVTTRWFGMRIDIISSLFIAIVALSSVPLSATLNAGLVGLALTYAISLNGTFQFCVRQSAEVEALMVSAERVMAYGMLDTEASLETEPSVKLSSDWPTKGHIELSNVSYRHSNEGPLVLRGITCDIKPSEKIGIVGRTGAGKSSLIGALFRLAEPTGSIKIDGVETTQLGLHDVRSNMSIIPQDPVLFGASVRYNLDPFQQYDDDRIWRTLEQVQLKSAVEELEGGLESLVSEGGGNLSVGQRQLFCLARALLQSNTILILDEATANVDMETDAIIQQVIREQFSNCTVLTIAHRLDTVMDSDRIMILRSGELVEFDVPHILLSQSSSYLSKLVEQTGPNNAERLRNIALESYNNSNNKSTCL